MGKKRIAEISVVIGLIIAVTFSVADFGIACASVRNNVVRLHILANSDSETDQSIKLAVRDALLRCGNTVFNGCVTKDNAEDIIYNEKEKLVEIANNVLKTNGYDYKAEIYLVEEYYETRSYENYTMPAGEYLSLKVVLGEGKGHNWWCVMFPPLCLPAAQADTSIDVLFTEDGATVIKSNPAYDVRFRLVELYEEIRIKFTDIFKG